MAAPTAPAGSEGLSFQTLLVASLASAGAALITSLFWKQGTIMAAALTPVLVTLLREALHRPAARLSSARTGGQPRAAGAGVGAASAAGVAGAAGAAASGASGAPTRSEGAEAPTATVSLGGPETEPLHTPPTPAEPETRVGEGKTEPLPSAAAGAGDEATRRLDPEALTEGPTPRVPTRVSGSTGEPTEPLRERGSAGHGAAGAGLAGVGAAGAAGGAGATRPPGGPPSDRGAPPRRPDGTATPAGYSRYSAARARAARGLTPRRVRVALVTGLLAFLIAAVAITVPELITGESIGGGGGGTTLFPSERASDSGSSGGIEDSPIDEDQGGSSGEDPGGGAAPDPSAGSSDPGGSGGSQPDQGSGSPDEPASPSQSGSEARKSSAAPSQPSGGDSGRP